MRDGGYDEGYKSVPCFWGTEPGSMVRMLTGGIDVRGGSVLDLGAGEGKNAHFLATLGARVEAWEISELALANSQARPNADAVLWRRQDAVELSSVTRKFDVIIAYGLMHCLSASEIPRLIADMQRCTAPGGFNIVVAFNDRSQDIAAAHPGFLPTLVRHDEYLQAYEHWEKWHVSDSDLVESHPHNNIQHTHSMTRILARNILDG